MIENSGYSHIDLATKDMEANGLQLEYCHLMRPFIAEDAIPQARSRREGRRELPVEA